MLFKKKKQDGVLPGIDKTGLYASTQKSMMKAFANDPDSMHSYMLWNLTENRKLDNDVKFIDKFGISILETEGIYLLDNNFVFKYTYPEDIIIPLYTVYFKYNNDDIYIYLDADTIYKIVSKLDQENDKVALYTMMVIDNIDNKLLNLHK